MNLYEWEWNDEDGVDHAPGSIVVMAESVPKARVKAKEVARLEFVRQMSMSQTKSGYERASRHHDRTLKDLSQEPKVIEDGVIFFPGWTRE